MTASRSRTQVKQMKHDNVPENKHRACPFCSLENDPHNIVQATKHFWVIPNKYPYSLWDSQKVKSHLLIVPRTHTSKLGSLGAGAGVEFLNLIDKYESHGYNVYARAPGSLLKTVEHQHTHLIQPHGKVRKLVLYLRKPYLRLHK